MTDPVAVLEELAKKWRHEANEIRMKWGYEERACASADATELAASELDAAIAMMRAPVGATGKLNGYMRREKAIEILMDSEIPMWMTNTPGIRVTVSAAPPAAKQERDDA